MPAYALFSRVINDVAAPVFRPGGLVAGQSFGLFLSPACGFNLSVGCAQQFDCGFHGVGTPLAHQGEWSVRSVACPVTESSSASSAGVAGASR